jgi:hypothetical protein
MSICVNVNYLRSKPYVSGLTVEFIGADQLWLRSTIECSMCTSKGS